MRVFLLTVGDEILIGQIVDTNSSWMAKRLNAIGAGIAGIRSVGDDPDEMRASLEAALEISDAVLITGGLGPTRDDKTKEVLADFFGLELVFHKQTYAGIIKLFERLGRSPTDAHYRQAFMPVGADILENKMGTAPGMWFERDGKVVVSMPGVPYEMKSIMEEVLQRLKSRFPGIPLKHRTLLTVGEGESRIAKRIEAFEDGLPKNLKLAYLPGLGQVRLRLTATGDTEEKLGRLLNEKGAELEAVIPELVFGYDEDTLEAVVGGMLRDRGLSIGTAESCTGGFIAHTLTSVPGSSEYFLGSVVAYSNEIKMKLLGVGPSTLEEEGAVSRATVVQMLTGSLDTLGTDLGIAISGIAGPGGGSPEKPVGTIWIAVGDKANVSARVIHSGKNRKLNIEYGTVAALNMLRQFMEEFYPEKALERQ